MHVTLTTHPRATTSDPHCRYDPRLSFQNLKEGKFENPLSPEVTQNLWVPRLGLLNGLSEFQTIVTEEDAEIYRGYVWRRSKPNSNSLEDSIESNYLRP